MYMYIYIHSIVYIYTIYVYVYYICIIYILYIDLALNIYKWIDNRQTDRYIYVFIYIYFIIFQMQKVYLYTYYIPPPLSVSIVQYSSTFAQTGLHRSWSGSKPKLARIVILHCTPRVRLRLYGYTGRGKFTRALTPAFPFVGSQPRDRARSLQGGWVNVFRLVNPIYDMDTYIFKVTVFTDGS